MHRSLFIVPAVVVALAAGTAAAEAKAVTAELRVEAAGKAIDGGTKYVTDTVKVRTDRRSACGGSGKTKTIAGPTAMGVLVNAAPVNTALRPVGISDKFPLGLIVCGLGKYVGFESSYWSLKVNRKSAEVGGDKYRLKPGDEVLWAFVDPSTKSNTGDELVVDAPGRFTPGKPFSVTVWAYDFAGKRKPAAGATVGGQTTDANGKATITSARKAPVRLRATRGSDIASEPELVCAGACPPENLVGRSVADTIKGTADRDRVKARGGADRINVAGGGADVVDCGAGKDSVLKDRRDRAAKNCERVVNRR